MFHDHVNHSESQRFFGHMDRTYEKTHPWIKFELDLNRFPYTLWLQLGEAKSKCEHLAGTPLQPGTAKKLNRILLAKGVLATTAIEGNTLSIEQVEQFLEGKLHLPASQEYLKTEIENIVRACNNVIDHIRHEKALPLTVEDIQSFNRTVLNKLSLDPEVVPGELRKHNVGVGRYSAPPWQDCPYLLERLTSWIETLEQAIPADLGLAGAMLRAILAHLYVAWIHPFGDGNGRTARLIEFAILAKAGVPMPAAHLFSDYYNQTRSRYYQELDRASKSGGDIVPFICYAVGGFVDGLRAQIDTVKTQQLGVAWTNYVHEILPDDTETTRRRRKLIFALSSAAEPTRLKAVPTINAELALLYAKRTSKTMSRDINALHKVGLVRSVHGRVIANTEIMRAFLPVRAKTAESHDRTKPAAKETE
jgi:Fic family protein